MADLDGTMAFVTGAREIAATALFLAGPGASSLTGQVSSPNGGLVIRASERQTRDQRDGERVSRREDRERVPVAAPGVEHPRREERAEHSTGQQHHHERAVDA